MATRDAHATRNGDHIDIGRVHAYYEVNGSGDPLILLHGGMCTAETFDGQMPALAEHYRVYLPERRAHGRTPDVPGPITYEIMAQDTIAFIEAVGIEHAHLVGWSDGALVGLLVALWRPELVGKLVLMAQSLNWGAVRPELAAFLGHSTKEMVPSQLKQAYEALSPDGPDHLDAVLDKILRLWNTDPAFPLQDLERVAAPTLVLAADDDVFLSIEHAAAVARARCPSRSSRSCPVPRMPCRWRSPSSSTHRRGARHRTRREPSRRQHRSQTTRDAARAATHGHRAASKTTARDRTR
jgi:pimeloyl-ACP methyl ester carboxylesterase